MANAPKDAADQLIAHLGLAPHPEGGWYKETWKGPQREGRASGTAIFFLLKAGERSHWHKVDADEIWLWHGGAPLVLSIGRDHAENHILGPAVLDGELPQIIVPAGYWQAAQSTGDYTLVSCTVSPGFDFAGFTLAPNAFDLPRAEGKEG
ncbi:cupin domain-containing protein [Thioclava sp. FR2]|uniref:cupin domain-containing protein n=1 Tax=Thioclava sp. FR2 TaxID=3445780 RepID=UPI003EBA8ABD